MAKSKKFKPTPASEWKKKVSKKGVEMTLPSGFTCMARRVDMMTFMKTGKIPNSLRPMIDKAMAGKEVSQEEVMGVVAGEDFAAKLIEGDPEAIRNFEEMMTLVDAVVVSCMIEPTVVEAPKTEEERSDTLLHVDEIDQEDRMFIFNFAVGGSSDLEAFREGQASNVEYLLSEQGGFNAAQPAS